MTSTHGSTPEPDENTKSATDKAYTVVRGEILSCALAPGTEIFEGEIAERLQMSKTPVKKALGMLVHEGFVEVRPRHGYKVTDITLADVQEIFVLRQIIEPAAAELAATNATAEQLQQMRSLVEDNANDTFEQRAANTIRFHEILAEASGNERLAAVLAGLMYEMQRIFSLGLDIEDGVSLHAEEHRELLGALLKGNHHLAREIAEHQIETGRMRIFEAILASLTSAGGAADSVVLRPVTNSTSSGQ